MPNRVGNGWLAYPTLCNPSPQTSRLRSPLRALAESAARAGFDKLFDVANSSGPMIPTIGTDGAILADGGHKKTCRYFNREPG